MRRLLAWQPIFVIAAAVIYLAMLVLGSALEAPQPLQQANDKVLHVLAYGLLSALLFLGLRLPLLWRSVAVVLLIAALGATDEAIQSFFPHRDSDVRDWIADVAAAVCVCIVLSVVENVRGRLAVARRQ